MRSNKTSSFGTRGGEPGLTNRGALETVQIASDLIAFYPQAIHHQQPYVILLDPATGILKRPAVTRLFTKFANWRFNHGPETRALQHFQ